MKPNLLAVVLILPLAAALPVTATPLCRAEAVSAIKQTAAYRLGSVREKQALLRSQNLLPVCETK